MIDKKWFKCKKHNLFTYDFCPICNKEVEELKLLICNNCNERFPLAFFSHRCPSCDCYISSKYDLKDEFIKKCYNCGCNFNVDDDDITICSDCAQDHYELAMLGK